MSGTRAVTQIRLAEILAALSLVTDVGRGVPMETTLRSTVLAARFADALGLDAAGGREAYFTTVLRSLGCTSHAHENAALLGGDDLAFQRLFHRLDPGHPAAFVRDVVTEMGAWNPPLERARTVARFIRAAPSVGPYAARSGCEVSVSLATRLGLPPGVVAALAHVYERWDGKGIPDGRAGEEIAVSARIAHLVEVAERAHAAGGIASARDAVAHRSGGHLDPSLAAAFGPAAAELLAGLDQIDALAAALEAEPRPHSQLPEHDLVRCALALADVVDLKSPWTLGHSTTVATLAAGAAGDAVERDRLRIAGLLHDVGRVSVPNGIWDKRGPLTAAESERVRLHPHYTARILSRVPSLAPLASLAAADHERLDGSGYHRGLPAPAITEPMRVLAAADVYAALTSPRAHRPALPGDEAARVLRHEAVTGRLSAHACEAVLEAAGHTPVRTAPLPHGLTEREVEVLRLAARGLTNKEIAAELFVSPRTIQHHLAHVYEKIDRHTRAGAALFAMEHGLLGPAR